MKTIDSFSGRYFFLSNFYPAPVYILVGRKWVKCQTVEHAYQASKTLIQRHRLRILHAVTPQEAKRIAHSVELVSYWEDVKTVIMLELLRQKFSRSVLRSKLNSTNPSTLIEGNTWHDNFWGVCVCGNDASSNGRCSGVGENRLGLLLTRVRKDVRP
jgi:ribA/ribD-fused uncharacterized protein